MNNALEIQGLNFSYNGSPVLENISFSVEEGSFFGVIGPNGGGKTTLLKLVLGQLRPQKGELKVFGNEPAAARKMTGYMPQYSTVNNAHPLTVREIAAMGLFNDGDLFPVITKKKRNKIGSVLERLGISSLAGSYFSELSGGQKQRALLARAVISSPKLLLLDEPTASVDYHAEKDIYDYLRELHKEMTIILVTHDVSVVSSLVNTIVCLNRNAAVHPVSEVTSEMIGKELYNRDVDLIHHTCHL